MRRSGLILLWILPISCAISITPILPKPPTGHLLNLQLKENLTKFLSELKEAAKRNYVQDKRVEYFANRLKTFNEGESQKLAAQKPYYKNMIGAAQDLFEYIEFLNKHSPVEYYPAIKGDDRLPYHQEFADEYKKLIEEAGNYTEDQMEKKIRDITENGNLLGAMISDDHPRSQELEATFRQLDRHFVELRKIYENNRRIMTILGSREPSASGKALEGKVLNDKEYGRFASRRLLNVTKEVINKVGGIYVIYIDGQCEIYSTAADVYLSTFNCRH